ncbi:hypothetical protein I302_100455 [Kwoniella bestiolae CBS 10118]|uniref:HTH La-type RNA-binding domain-containing protein n=1 Tax=Kwoniella bestiolae CBS 10118 TaxID=1296100 RepID=A0A1B9G560_9TREE|nr:hypothetical protein I302_03829 [Kwoniella bestiolae CBS 10118]OCF26151.1 hypothetical protein I302_03829 [Kwoniella bestiolae CBS 10118]
MSTSTEQHPSAFNALGSYADRIKDANGNPTRPTSSPTPAPSSSLASNGDIGKTDSPSPSATPSSSSSSTVKPRATKSAPTPAVELSKETEQDGTWETVKSSRQRPRQQEEKEKHGSNSKNWRDRSHREGAGSSQKQRPAEESEKKSGQGKSNKKHGNQATTSTVPSGSTAKPAPISSAPTKPAWGALTHSTKPTSVASDTPEMSKENGQQSTTVPSSPSLNGTTATANSASIPPSIGSPVLSSDTASTSTANASVLSKAVDKLEEEGSWRARPKPQVEETPQPAPQPAQPRQAAPPPTVNAWEVRRKTMAPPASATVTNSSTSPQPKPAQSHSTKETSQKSVPNGHVKAETPAPKHKKKTAARATSSALPPPIHDAALWPDVSQASEVAKDEKKDKVKDKSTNEVVSVTEDSAVGTTTGKKPKWTPIPASELLAAVDQVAENNRRQNRAEASAKKRATASKADNEATGSASKGGKAKKGATQPGEAKKGGARGGRAGSTSEVKLPSIPNKQQAGSTNAGSTAGDVTLEEDTNGVDKKDTVNGDADIPLSRQTSKHSKAGSPQKGEHAQLPSTNKDASSPHLRFGSGPLQSRPMTGSNTAPLPQQGFNHNNNILPRVPRGRDGRASFNGRGRGGFRSNSAIAHPHKMHPGFGSPPLGGVSGLPMDGIPNPNANAFQRGFGGMGFQSFYPVQGYGQTSAGPGIYDPMQAQYGAGAMYRAGLPPPPMPQTVVPNLDATRFYVLGQIEYYFSMQNLAMDFFLRQQMDSEGWIDISMIASFNRVKSLTPDVSIVKECMVLSSLLEVKEESVRLAGSDASRWVLPDARKSQFANDTNPTNPLSPSQATEESLSADHSLISEEGQRGPTSSTAADVENALMKSSNVVSAPVVNGDAEAQPGKTGEDDEKEEDEVKA